MISQLKKKSSNFLSANIVFALKKLLENNDLKLCDFK
jgi:hypothetical protein